MSLIQKKELMEHELKKRMCIVSDDHCIDKKQFKGKYICLLPNLKNIN